MELRNVNVGQGEFSGNDLSSELNHCKGLKKTPKAADALAAFAEFLFVVECVLLIKHRIRQ